MENKKIVSKMYYINILYPPIEIIKYNDNTVTSKPISLQNLSVMENYPIVYKNINNKLGL